MDSFQAEQYLRRTGISGAVPLDLDGLAALQVAHLKSVPFENLGIAGGIPVGLDLVANFGKIVGRGGYCYELNGLFADLLTSLGFDMRLLSARVAMGKERFGPAFDHLMLLVNLGENYLVGVGFGDSFIRPLRLDSGLERTERGETYMVLRLENDWALCRRRAAPAWETMLLFSLAPRTLPDFAEQCSRTQNSPESHFVRNAICTRLTDDGRKTLSGSRMIVTTGDHREESVVDEVDRRRHLLEHFGIALDR